MQYGITGYDLTLIRYRYYLLKSLGLEHMNSDSAVPGLNRDAAHARIVCVPTNEGEQKAIACILGALDNKIELNRRMNKTLEEMARAIFKSWFVDFDPVRAKAVVRRENPNWTNAQVSRTALPKLNPEIAALFPDSFEDSELGKIPKGWMVKPFSDTVDIIGGGTPKTSVAEYWNGEIPWFSVVDAPSTSDVWVIETEKKITTAGIDNSSTKVLPVGTTIISARGTVGRTALIGVPMAMNQSCYGLIGKSGSQGFFNYFATRQLISTFLQRTHGSVFETITSDTFTSVNVVEPPRNIVEAFETNRNPFLKRILVSLVETSTLAILRDILLPKLISGELRVPDAEKIVKRCL